MADDVQRVVLITGAAGGIGQEITRGFLGERTSVIATDVNAGALDVLVDTCSNHPDASSLHTRTLDISDADACEQTVKSVSAQFGDINILINNGALGMGLIRDDHMIRLVDIEELSPAVWDRFMQTNLSGAWYLTRAVVPAMKQRGWGRIITITTSMFTMLRGGFHPYGPAKAGLEAMCAGHADEFRETGITVNVVVPGGPADTAMVPAESGFERTALVPPAAMVPPIVWLCSTDADAITGNRYVAAMWNDDEPIDIARRASEAPIAWPTLAAAPVWPGAKPD